VGVEDDLEGEIRVEANQRRRNAEEEKREASR